MERETRFELATNGLEGRDSTTELLPLKSKLVQGTGFEPVNSLGGQIYSLLPLTARPPLQRSFVKEPAMGLEPATY